VLQIFQEHARSTEARLQVMLAEIPYMKARLMADYDLEQKSKHSKANLGEKVFEMRRFALKQLAKRITAKIDRLRCQREKLRAGRQKQNVPSVAVVGYTNCGKTTLIKALTGSQSLEPRDQEKYDTVLYEDSLFL
jgi:50S ribosomal subunit-associated GTPase HflX